MVKVLILGGTAEARALAEALAPRHHVTTSLAGRTRNPETLPGTVRTGGFGGAEGLRRYVEENAIDAVIDATHPFAETISANARQACTTTPRLRLDRPAWTLPATAAVIRVPDMKQAAQRLPDVAKRAFLTVGADSLSAFHQVEGVWMLARVLEAPTAPTPFEIVVARPPFAQANERALLQTHAIDTVVAKDAGGTATEAKISAAIKEEVTLILIDRPAPEPGERVETVDDAVAWLESLVGC